MSLSTILQPVTPRVLLNLEPMAVLAHLLPVASKHSYNYNGPRLVEIGALLREAFGWSYICTNATDSAETRLSFTELPYWELSRVLVDNVVLVRFVDTRQRSFGPASRHGPYSVQGHVDVRQHLYLLLDALLKVCKSLKGSPLQLPLPALKALLQ